MTVYRQLLAEQPPLSDGLTAESIHRHSVDALTTYQAFVGKHDDYAKGLLRVRMGESSMRSLLADARRGINAATDRTPDLDARFARAFAEAQHLIAQRKFDGVYFLEETAELAGRIRMHEMTKVLAAFGGADPTVESLSENEEAALRTDALEAEKRELGTIQDQLEQVPGLRLEGGSGDEYISGLYRIEGNYEYRSGFIGLVEASVSAADNVIVGDTEPGSLKSSSSLVGVRRVVPINWAAIRLFESKEPHEVWKTLLKPIPKSELRP